MRLGNGYDSLLKQFINRNENMDRSTSKRASNALKGTTCISVSLNDLPKKVKRKTSERQLWMADVLMAISEDDL